ncbi:MAG: polysaccharide deacetylase family protein, partial [Nanoarchaeota archaeon]
MNVSLVFQIHQPSRLRTYRVFDIGKNHSYFDDAKNKEIMQKVSAKCYVPATKIVQSLLKKHPEFKVAYSITGTALEQMEKYAPEALALLKKVAASDRVEFLGETSHHSLASLANQDEFVEQIKIHSALIQKHFGKTPKTFRNTELIHTNTIATIAKTLGFTSILAEGAESCIGKKSPNNTFKTPSGIPALLRNYKLS